MLPVMRSSNIKGPIFISIGDSDKINLFLDKNPRVPRDLMLVDDFDMEAYKAAGLSKFTDSMKKLATDKERSIKQPKFGFGRWKDYLTSVGQLAPVEKGSTKFPQTVLMNGGTFAIRGSRLVFSYSDSVPGDHPDPKAVVEAFAAK
jgi:hypothetical protein